MDWVKTQEPLMGREKRQLSEEGAFWKGNVIVVRRMLPGAVPTATRVAEEPNNTGTKNHFYHRYSVRYF